MSSPPTVHVYDDAIETSEVLAAIYQPRGFEVRRVALGVAAEAGPCPGSAVVVLSSLGGEPFEGEHAPRKVLIGRVEEGGGAHGVAACRLSSLFDYRELVSAIDRLLCETD
jgi:hypothetical protein